MYVLIINTKVKFILNYEILIMFVYVWGFKKLKAFELHNI